MQSVSDDQTLAEEVEERLGLRKRLENHLELLGGVVRAKGLGDIATQSQGTEL